jgi:hypothetical protein
MRQPCMRGGGRQVVNPIYLQGCAGATQLQPRTHPPAPPLPQPRRAARPRRRRAQPGTTATDGAEREGHAAGRWRRAGNKRERAAPAARGGGVSEHARRNGWHRHGHSWWRARAGTAAEKADARPQTVARGALECASVLRGQLEQESSLTSSPPPLYTAPLGTRWRRAGAQGCSAPRPRWQCSSARSLAQRRPPSWAGQR